MLFDSFRVLPLLFLSSLVLARNAAAQDDLAKRVDQLERRNAELEGRLDALADEQEGMLLGDLVPPLGAGHHGLGTAASKVYDTDQGLSLGGYGEALYERHNGTGTDELDMLRAVLYVGYRFDEHWVFNSELEFEHAGEEVGVEFATLDYLHSQALNARGGLVLIPMGLVNELHEPTAFLGAKRPETESRILPTTWREVGAGLFGDAGPVTYRAYVVNGFDATGFTAQGVRDGRQDGSEALAEDLAVVARVDWTETPGLLAGGSIYTGGAGQDQAGLGSTNTTIGELHADWRSRGLWLRGLVALANVDDVAALNAANGFVGAESVGEEMEGMYVEAGYDVLGLVCPDSGQSLSPYVRFESYDTQKEVPAGFSSDPANDEEIVTMGLNWRPITNLVFKAEYQDLDESNDGVNVAMGFVF